MELDVELEGFSGPLDLLCHLVESGEMSASEISVSELIRVYSDFLIRNERATINEMAAFFSLTARLLLGKLKAILPSLPGVSQDHEEEIVETELIEQTLVRYRPYRAAAAYLAEMMRSRGRCFTRNSSEEGPPWFDMGDLYSLSVLWWEMVRRKREGTQSLETDLEEEWDGIPAATPEEEQVEGRMAEIEMLLSSRGALLLSEVLGTPCSRHLLVVTLLALLEMARLGRVRLHQEELFGDVRISG
ncbi:MAG TPA: segregation/condensation protein A [Synergistaceae bacterium]|jgi:segregation and condensation protein A|nr:MAG: Chromosome segregation and condensation protein ScpA [Synergistales bacterium 57_84]KUK88953.1 MAG: Chromosome segregation and condensation protein ScpA [Synergistales bacterium 58_81]HBG14010.1 segregation/condensation protein A [Synergistaceae bacterium]HPA58508.1 ScpA family protein [Synergistales bacterium]HCP07687.1 segregation/condensation protein A [Synergistaceae bacterium]